MSITAMTCPKCKSAMRWYSTGGYGFNPQWKCDRCGYDTANQTYRTSNKTEDTLGKVIDALEVEG